jgi:hypothetical protein
LALTAEQFEAFVTVDRNLSFQQKLAPMSIPIFVLHAKTNRLSDLRPLVHELLTIMETAQRGTAHVIRAADKTAG